MGNVTASIVKRTVVGTRRSVIADITFSNSYATGGDVFTQAIRDSLWPEYAGASSMAHVLLADAEGASDGSQCWVDKTNNKIKAFGNRAEVANATNLSGTVIRIEFQYGSAAN